MNPMQAALELAAAYRQHGAHFQVRGGIIVDTRE
jgi:hypothetical protein